MIAQPSGWFGQTPSVHRLEAIRAYGVFSFIDTILLVYRNSLGSMLFVSIGVSVVQTIVSVILALLFRLPISSSVTPSFLEVFMHPQGVVIAAILAFVTILVTLPFLLVVSLRGVDAYLDGEQLGLTGFVAINREPLQRLGGVTVVVGGGIGVIVAAIVGGIGYFSSASSQGNVVLVILLLLIGAAVVTFSGVIIVRWICVPAAIVMEKNGVLVGLARSWKLTHQSFWRIVQFMIATLLFALACNLIVVPLALLAAIAQTAVNLSVGGLAIISLMENLVVGAILGPIFPIAVGLVYYDLRVRREVYDLELRLEGNA